MRDVEAQLVHDMQNTAMVLREASARLNDDRDSMSPATVAHLTEMMVRRSDMLVRLLRDLSSAHLVGRGQLDVSLQGVSLAEICHDVLTAGEPAVGPRITVDIAEGAVVVADPVRITQVIDNLVTNALRYGGPNVRVSAVRKGSVVRLTVSDDGRGVPDDLVDTLFEAYVRGASSHAQGGSGLGLLIVRQLCGAMGGTIEYDGSVGAVFTATFPALPVSTMPLGADVAGVGHSVVLWESEADLVTALVSYVANGLAAGEAVLVAAEPAHLALMEERLTDSGIDAASALASGQYLPLDAHTLHTDLPRGHHIDQERFDSLIAGAVEHARRRWRGFRFFGEIVDLYWRRNDDQLALELEACWDRLRSEHPFPLLCGYELAAGDSARADAIRDCHDMVVSA